MHATWIDRHSKPHLLRITGQTARNLWRECDLNLLQCLVETGHIQAIITRLAENPDVLMAACACVEEIDPAAIDDYYGLWDGDAFEAASIALLEAISDFFPRRPRQILFSLLTKMKTASSMIGDKAVKVALQQIEAMDFSSVPNKLQIPGSGGTGSAESSATVPTT